MRYRLEAVKEPGQGWLWVVRGLPSIKRHWNKPDEPVPDTALYLVGMYHGCSTAESVVAAVHRALYDEYQVSEGLKKGDTIESEACQVGMYLSWDDKRERLDIPAMRFRVEGVHVLMDEPDPEMIRKAVEDEK